MHCLIFSGSIPPPLSERTLTKSFRADVKVHKGERERDAYGLKYILEGTYCKAFSKRWKLKKSTTVHSYFARKKDPFRSVSYDIVLQIETLNIQKGQLISKPLTQCCVLKLKPTTSKSTYAMQDNNFKAKVKKTKYLEKLLTSFMTN